jgi:hypothetical protein
MKIPESTIKRVGEMKGAIQTNRNRHKMSLKKILKDPEAKEAFDKLVKAKAKRPELRFWLLYIAALPDRKPSAHQDRRKALELARKARSLAADIEEAQERPPLSIFMPVGLTISKLPMLPAVLRDYARSWDETLSLRGPRDASPQSEAIAALVDYVKFHTGKDHYAEVVELLNATDLALYPANTGPRWDISNLKQLVFRARRRHAKIVGRH